jgi:dolichol kinase
MQMLDLIVAAGPIFILLVLSEILWRSKILRGEAARKVLHIFIGCYIAAWPFLMPFRTIQLISIALLVVVYISHTFHVFHAINGVKRKTWGDVLYAVAIGVTASLTKNPWVFTIAILHMSLADGLAGLVGTHYGKRSTYTILGYEKSFVGSVTFILSSFVILIATATHHPQGVSFAALGALPFIAAGIENLGIAGTDNVLIPLLIVAVFSLT